MKVLEKDESRYKRDQQTRTYKSYNRFMTNFSIPSIAFSKSASVQFFQISHSLIWVAMN